MVNLPSEVSYNTDMLGFSALRYVSPSDTLPQLSPQSGPRARFSDVMNLPSFVGALVEPMFHHISTVAQNGQTLARDKHIQFVVN